MRSAISRGADNGGAATAVVSRGCVLDKIISCYLMAPCCTWLFYLYVNAVIILLQCNYCVLTPTKVTGNFFLNNSSHTMMFICPCCYEDVRIVNFV